MERIAPLAKILAEANGIDWQHLKGSGEGGQIVEQDILTHLARIMSGEEEPPPTPVDAPPPDWNGEDIPGGGMFSADMLSKAGVDSDIAAFVEQTRPGADVAAPAASAAADDEDMEFELEEEDTPAAAEPIPAPIVVSQPAQPMAASEPLPAPTAASVPAPTPPASGGAAAGLGSLLSRLYKTSPAAETPAQPAASAVPAAAPEVPVQPPVTPVMAPTPVVETPTIRDTPVVRETPVVEETPAVPAVAPNTPVVEEPVEETPVAAEVQTPAPSFPAVSPTPEPVTVPVAPRPEPVVSPVATPAATQPAPVQPAAVQDATWFGVYLRRDASLGAVTELRTQLTDALGRDVPLSLLVARAAQRHSDRLGLGSVALHDGHRARSVSAGHLRDALQGLDTDFDGTPDLLIVDAGARNLDDLHFPHTLTLSIGRVQDGRAALSLNGNVDTANAAQFLADLAGTLERPIVLVL